MPAFFVPMVDADKQEDAYQEIARVCGANPAAEGHRIYNVTWKHHNTIWTATVGKKLHGVETITHGRGKSARTRELAVRNEDTVIAIFPGVPGLIAHDNKSQRWNVPILTGEWLSSTRFDG